MANLLGFPSLHQKARLLLWSFSASPSSAGEGSPVLFPESGVAPRRPQLKLLGVQGTSDAHSGPCLLRAAGRGQFSLSVPRTHVWVLSRVLGSCTLGSFLCHNFHQQTSCSLINQWLLLNPSSLLEMDIVLLLKEATGSFSWLPQHPLCPLKSLPNTLTDVCRPTGWDL